MTSRRIEPGSFVSERRKTEPISVYGKVKSECRHKVWNVMFFGKEETEERKSAQLAFVDQLELPQEFASWLGPKEASSSRAVGIGDKEESSSSESSSSESSNSDNEEKNSSHRVQGIRSRTPQIQQTPIPTNDQFPSAASSLSDNDSNSNSDSDYDQIEESGNSQTIRRKSIYGKSVQRGTVTKEKTSKRRLSRGDSVICRR